MDVSFSGYDPAQECNYDGGDCYANQDTTMNFSQARSRVIEGHLKAKIDFQENAKCNMNY